MTQSIDIEKMKQYLVGVSLADHMGDVNYYLPLIAKELGLEPCEFDEEYERMVFPWEDTTTWE